MFTIALALASSVGVTLAHPHALSSRDVAAFPAGSSWDILLSKGEAVGNLKQAANEKFQVIDIDLFDTDKQTIADLKTTKQVICYFSAGSKEGWRPDAGDFKEGDTGKGVDGWPDELWINPKSDNVRNIMKKRIQIAADKGCTAVDPDNVDGFGNGQDGFGYDKSVYIDYVKFMAQEAKSHNLAIGLKNALDIIPDVVDVMQFTVNEQCHEYNECGLYKPFTDQNKAVFNIEYGGNRCDSPSGIKLSTLIKSEDQALNALGGACAGQGQGTPTNGQKPESSKPAASSAPVGTQPKPTPTAGSTPKPSPTTGGRKPTPTACKPQEPEEEPEEEDGDDEDDDKNHTG